MSEDLPDLSGVDELAARFDSADPAEQKQLIDSQTGPYDPQPEDEPTGDTPSEQLAGQEA